MRREKKFCDGTQSLCYYSKAFREYYAVGFVEARVLNIFDSKILSNRFAVSSTVTSARYICTAKVMIKKERILSVPVRDMFNAQLGKTLDVTNLQGFSPPMKTSFPL